MTEVEIFQTKAEENALINGGGDESWKIEGTDAGQRSGNETRGLEIWGRVGRCDVGEYVKRQKALENFVRELDVACRTLPRESPRERPSSRVDPFQSKADQHSSRLDYSPGISSLASSPC